ncbi:MAG: hypothetical protein IJK41_00670 [Muribaculaceae bacterium]|nr:hypothetical protein [Muribaculaceae bacterium]
MKNKKNSFLLLAMVVCILLTGCRGEGTYDKRLTVADSLMSVNADSALWQLQHINSQELGSPHDRAYHALLLTQARYKCYVTATSDSAINSALKYYQQHPAEREKLTRAYLYKGAVMEELGQIEPAMTYYKKALETADFNDYFNQGYIRYRIGRIYRDHLIADSTDITYFKEALQYFKLVPDSFYILWCLNDLGTSYNKNNRDSVLPYLSQAISLAQRLGNTKMERKAAINIAKATMFSSHPQDIERSKTTVLPLLEDRQGCSPEDLADLLMTAAYTLAKQNKPDSALLFLNQLPKELPNSSYESFRLLCQAEISRSRGDIDRFAHYSEEYRQLKESIINDEMQCQLRDVESQYDNETLKLKNERYKWLLTSWVLVGLLALSILGILLLLFRHKLSMRKRQLADREATIERLQGDSIRLSALLEDNKVMGEHLKETLKNQILTFSQLVETYRKDYSDNPKKFGEAFKNAYDMNQPDASFWKGIQAYANLTHGGIVNHAIENHPSLNITNIHLLSLLCCDLPTTVAMACMGYNEVHSFYNKKRRLAQALRLKGTLEDYIEGWRIHDDDCPIINADND